MKVAVIGGGAMGGVVGGRLAQAGADVTLVDVWREAIDTINADGLLIDHKSGEAVRVPGECQSDHRRQSSLRQLIDQSGV
jgi:ketopantoate reductase